MQNFIPDYNNMIQTAKNINVERLPIYEHSISPKIMRSILNDSAFVNPNCSESDRVEFFTKTCEFYKLFGYDTVSYEWGIVPILPNGGALTSDKRAAITDRNDFDKYPWDSLKKIFFKTYEQDFRILRKVMPDGMKAIGGVGYGIFECVQDLVGFEALCYIAVDDEELFKDLFIKFGDIFYDIWKEFLKKYGDTFAVCRIGDDLGFKSATMFTPQQIRQHIIPQYARVIALIHSYNKPFLLHSCGKIFDIMDDLINVAKIDAKHSNEDNIAEFHVWVEKYGDKIGNFGGFDVDFICRNDEKTIKEYVKEIIRKVKGKGGIAFGSGNSIPDYVPVANYIAMVEAIRENRIEK
jgi:uroporphyrinogen decarboxylase